MEWFKFRSEDAGIAMENGVAFVAMVRAIEVVRGEKDIVSDPSDRRYIACETHGFVQLYRRDFGTSGYGASC